ncbi:MAG TPA: acetate--CoA ligase family protein [Acidimicrobiia bacterium]|nr:acetate--CoA ligase family protein [Acidimicrobiia bacterium]
MSGLGRLLGPASIAIVGLSADPAKHGGRVLANLRKLGYSGEVWGVNPGLPDVDGLEVFSSLGDLPEPPDLVVCAVPATAVGEVAMTAERVGALVVFAGGFGESGDNGRALETDLIERVGRVGSRLLGPNSGGVIRPSVGLAASFLTCLDRPADQIRSGPVGLVTQSGGTGSYIHNLAAARGGGLAVSVSTGNEADIRLGEAIYAVSALGEVRVTLAMIETVRDGVVFIDAVRDAIARGKPVVACRIGTGDRGRALMTTHTGAMAVPEEVLEGVLESLGVVVAETPGEAYDIAEMLARAPLPEGDRAAIVTHSGGVAIHLADLADKRGLDLTQPGPELKSRLDPLLDLGAANNPLDMGGIIGGPGRFAEVVDRFARSGEYDMVLAVSTAHPPAHSAERARALMELETVVPILHLWMAGDQATGALRGLREAGVAVTEEPRAAIRALAGLARLAKLPPPVPVEPIDTGFEDWGLPLVEGETARTSDEAIAVAESLGYPAVVKVVATGLAHKTEVGGVRLGLANAAAVAQAIDEVTEAATAAGHPVGGVRVERYRPGLEMIIGGLVDQVFGPLVSVGIGGVLTELIGDVVFAPAPVDQAGAVAMIDRMRGRALLDGYRGSPPSDVYALARIVSLVSRGVAGSGLVEVELNPLIWDGEAWVAVDWLLVQERGDPMTEETTSSGT